MDNNRFARFFCPAAIIAGALLWGVSPFVYGVGFLVKICALLCFFAAFFASLFLSPSGGRMQKVANVLKKMCVAVLALGLVSLIAVEGLIISGWPRGEPEPADCLIILGAGLRGDQLSSVLYSRVALAADYLQKHPGCTAVVSGGQGPDESITEALAMKRYLEGRGIDPTRIIMEDKSTNTEENLRFSLDMLREKGLDGGKIAVLSNSFHLYRAKRLASALGYTVQGIGSPIPKQGLVPLNSYVREYFSVMFMFAKELIN